MNGVGGREADVSVVQADRNGSALAAGSARAAKAGANAGADCNRAAAVAAAAADRLRENALRPGRRRAICSSKDIARIRDVDCAAVGAGAAVAARREETGGCAAIAAAAADRLSDDARRQRARRRQGPTIGDANRAALRRAGPGSAERDEAASAGAIAALPADRLRLDRDRAGAEGRNRARVGHGDDAAIAAGVSVAAQSDEADDSAGGAAAAANRLG